MPDQIPDQSLAEAFHLIESLVPPDQKVVAAQRDWTVGQALEVMREHRFTQLPVVSGDYVMGVLSYRSLVEKALAAGHPAGDLIDLPVEEFIEQLSYVQPTSRWESSLEALDTDDAVLVGNPYYLQGILTPIDVLQYLRDLAKPFVILAEIEVSLRRLIAACVSGRALASCIETALSEFYSEEKLPTSLDSMTFNDYRQIICDGRNWPRFAKVFGRSEYQRKRTRDRLAQVRDVRNAVFHFKRTLQPDELVQLDGHRTWLEQKARAFEGQRRATRRPKKTAETPKVTAPSRKRQMRQWDESAFMEELAARASRNDVSVARELFAWGREHADEVRWGAGSKTGTFTPKILEGDVEYSLFIVTTRATFQFCTGNWRGKPPLDSFSARKAVAERLNQIDGINLSDYDTDHYPSYPLSLLLEQERRRDVLAVLEDVIRSIKEAD